MDEAKRRAAIRLQAAKNKDTEVNAMGMGSSKPSSKGDCAPKKQKVSSEPVLGLMVKGTKTVTPAKHGGGKGFMIPPLGSQKKLPIYSTKIPSMPWRSSCRLLASRIMKT